MLRKRQSQQGDTLIEVLFAFVVLSLVIIGALAIMNQGSIAAQRSLETTIVRQEIDSQATALRFLHDAYVAAYRPNITFTAGTAAARWKEVSDRIGTSAPTDILNATTCPTPADDAFIIDGVNAKLYGKETGKLNKADTFGQVTYRTLSGTEVVDEAQGLWIEGIRSGTNADTNKQNVQYIDFHIIACWPNPGQGPPMTIGTIVRLYEPR